MDRRCLAPVEVAARNAKLHADNGIVPTNAVATAKANARRRRRIESCNICMYFGLLLEGAGNEWSLGEFPQSGTGKQGPALRRDDRDKQHTQEHDNTSGARPTSSNNVLHSSSTTDCSNMGIHVPPTEKEREEQQSVPLTTSSAYSPSSSPTATASLQSSAQDHDERTPTSLLLLRSITSRLPTSLVSSIDSHLSSKRKVQAYICTMVSLIALLQIYRSVSVYRGDKETGAEPYDVNAHAVLPRRVITIFGLESSGTTFLYQTLSKALNATVVIPDLSARAGDDVEIQHISQPWGLFGTKTGGYSTIDLVPPLGCASFYDREEVILSDRCQEETGLDPEHEYPLRFFVNITSHVEWYRSRGVDCTAIIMTRDYSTHLDGKKKHMLWPLFWNRVAAAEDRYGKQLMVEAMSVLDASISPARGLAELVLVSYETLMFLREDYLFKVYQQLGIESDYVPTFHDGNAKYVRGGKAGINNLNGRL